MSQLSIIERINWALHTIREKLNFGLPEDIAVYRREARSKALLVDSLEYIKTCHEDINILCDYFLDDYDSSFDEDYKKVLTIKNKYKKVINENIYTP